MARALSGALHLMSGLVFDPILAPAFIWALGIFMAAASAWVYLTAGARLGRGRNGFLLALRLIGIAIILVLLFQPSRRVEIPELRTRRTLLVGVDVSRSMKQQDAGKMSRLDAARTALRNASLLEESQGRVRLFQFDADAAQVAPEQLESVRAEGTSTLIHHSIETMMRSLQPGESAAAVLLLSDGHDFEAVNPLKTAALLKSRHASVYAVPVGEQGRVRDASLHITNFEPYSYARQKAHISAVIRLIGCEHEKLVVQLLRRGQVVQSLQANAGELREVPVDFEVTELEAGQYEYELRVVSLPKEIDTRNNSAITFLNVIDQRMRVLLLEGAPYWDTTFLRRSLGANDKIALDALLQYAPDKTRRLRSGPSAPGDAGPVMPATQDDFNRYDVIILGKAVDVFFDQEKFAMLVSFVKDRGGSVIFSRGQAFKGALGKENELEPVQWSDRARDRVQLQVGREGARLSPFRVLAESGGIDALPPLLAARQAGDRKTLAALLAQAHDGDSGAECPAMVHRRMGRGQVLSIAVDGLWKWSFNPKAAATNNVFDRFWDQLVVWMVASGDAMPNKPYSFRAGTSNLVLGAKMHFRLTMRDTAKAMREAPVTIYFEDRELARLALAADPSAGGAFLAAEYLPEKVGKYRAVVTLPNGEKQEVKWMVFEENPEEKEVAADVAYLAALCESTGGKLLQPAELAKFAEELQHRDEEHVPKVQLSSVWDRPWVFYVIGAVLGLDWFLRRKWGLS